MTTDLEQALRASGNDLVLDRPVADVLDRGHQLRRRRSRRMTVGAVAATFVGVSALSMTLPQEASPIPAADAAWGPALVNLADDDLAAAERACRAMARDDRPIPEDVQPRAADSRGGVTMLVYRDEDYSGACMLDERDDGYRPRAHSWGDAAGLPTGVHIELIALGFATRSETGPTHSTAGAVEVSESVARVEIAVGGQTVAARVDEGVAMFWLPDGLSQGDVDSAVATAYDAEGVLLATRDL